MTMSQTKKYVRGPILDISVPKEIIEEAVRGDSGHCMIAEAVKAHVPWAEFISVDLQTIRITDRKKGLRFTYLTPRACQQLLINFDEGINPKPFSFRLKAAHVSRSSVGTGVGKIKNGKKLPNKAMVVTSDGEGTVARRVGGRPPPKAPSSNTRREFGLRSYRTDASRVPD